MQIRNPNSEAIENVKIFGVLYSIEGEGVLNNVPEAHARYWQENLHKFLILRKDKLEEEKKEEVVEVPQPSVVVVENIPETDVVIEPVVEKTVEEVKEEAVVVPTKPKGRPKIGR